MKRIAYSFLLIFAMSCGSSQMPMRYHIVLSFQDSIKKDYFLLAIHNNSLIVAPYIAEESVDLGSLTGSAEAIPFLKIKSVIHPERATGGDEFEAGLLGCAAGGTIGGCMALSIGYGESGYENFPLQLFLLTPVIGIGAGILLADLSLHTDLEYSLQSKSDIELLRRCAYYSKEEPPQLLLLK